MSFRTNDFKIIPLEIDAETLDGNLNENCEIISS